MPLRLERDRAPETPLAVPSEACLPISATPGPDLLPGVSLTVVSLPGCECKFSQPGSHPSCHPSCPWIWVRAWFCFPESGPALLCQSDSLRNLSAATPCSRHYLGGLQNPVCSVGLTVLTASGGVPLTPARKIPAEMKLSLLPRPVTPGAG